MAIFGHLDFSKFKLFLHSTVIDFGFCVLIQNLAKSHNPLLSYGRNGCFPIWRPPAVLNLEVRILVTGFLADRTVALMLQCCVRRLSVCLSVVVVCDVMYCG